MPIQMSPVRHQPVLLRGGLDLITPTLALKPGVPRDALNLEILESGNPGRIAGYERYSGQPRPSDAVYGLLFLTAFTNTPAVGNTIANGAATASGYVIAVGDNYIAYTKAVGTFAIGDSLLVGATPIGTAVTPTGGMTPAVDATLRNLAADVYRADIAKPTGSGPIRGVFVYNDIRYCLRDNAGATAQNLWKSSSTGWQAVTLFNEVSFTAGGAATPVDGETLTQGGNTATVKRVVHETGAWTGTAAGRFIITTPTPGNFAAGAATLSGGATVTLSGVQTAITLSPGGRGDVAQANFYGQASSARIYYADGVNRMWEFDGTTLVPLNTAGLIPRHLAAHKRYLFYSVNSSIFYRAVGNPYATTGGGEIATGDTVTGFLVIPGAETSAALAVLNRNWTNILYGTSASDWNLVAYNAGTGALEYTLQNMAQSCLLDDRGVFTLQTSLNFGNFEQASLTHLIRPFIAAHRPYVSCSGLNRLKSQYRVFYSDGYGLYVTVVNNKFLGAMPVKFPIYAYCTWESTLTTGENVILMGGSDGHVHEMERGTSFDGDPIVFYGTFNWNAQGDARQLKRYRRASVEVTGDSYARFAFAYQLGYGSQAVTQPAAANYEALMSQHNWDAVTWDNFTWDGRSLLPTDVEMLGTAENVEVTLSGSSDEFEAFAFNSVTIHYSVRRGLR